MNFRDLTAMQALYGTGAGNIFPGSSGIGMIGSEFRVAVNGLGNNDVTFGVNTSSVPDGGTTLVLLGGALTGLGALRRKFRA
jgi:hypothetical protein